MNKINPDSGISSYYSFFPPISQQTGSINSVPLSFTGKDGDTFSLYVPELPCLDRLSMEEQTDHLKNHLLLVLGHFLSTTFKGRQYVILGEIAMAIHLAAEVSTGKAPGGTDKLFEMGQFLPPLSIDKYHNIDLSINSAEPDIDAICQYLKSSLNNGVKDACVEFTVTKPDFRQEIHKNKTPDRDNKTVQTLLITGASSSIIIKYNNEKLLNINISYSPTEPPEQSFKCRRPYFNHSTLKTAVFSGYHLEVCACTLDQLIENLQLDFIDSYIKGSKTNNKHLNQLKTIENLIKSKTLPFNTDDITTTCWTRIIARQHSRPAIEQKEQVSPPETKDQSANTFTPTFSDSSTSTHPYLKNKAVETDPPSLKNRGTNTAGIKSQKNKSSQATTKILDKSTQTEAKSSINNNENNPTSEFAMAPELIRSDSSKLQPCSPEQKTKNTSPKYLKKKFKDKLQTLTSVQITGRKETKSIDYHEDGIKELFDIYNRLITPEANWISIADADDLRKISSNIMKLRDKTKTRFCHLTSLNNDISSSFEKMVWAIIGLEFINYHTLVAYRSISNPEQIKSEFSSYIETICITACSIIEKQEIKNLTFKNKHYLIKFLEKTFTTIADIIQNKFPKLSLNWEYGNVLPKIIRSLDTISTDKHPDFLISHLNFCRLNSLYYARNWPDINNLTFTIMQSPDTSKEVKVTHSNFQQMIELYTWLHNNHQRLLAAIVLTAYLTLIGRNENFDYFTMAATMGFFEEKNQATIKQIYHHLTCDPVTHPVDAPTQRKSERRTRAQLNLRTEISSCLVLFESKKIRSLQMEINDPKLHSRMKFWKNIEIKKKEESA